MATDTEQLVVTLEARVNAFEKAFQRANRTASQNWSAIENRGRQASKRIETDMTAASARVGAIAARGFGMLGVGIGGVEATRAITSAASRYVGLQNQLRVTGLEGDKLQTTFDSLFTIAQKNGTALEPLTTLYSRAAQAQGELNASSADLLRFTDGVSVALRVAGTDSTQAAGALLQLSQALGGGVVRAEELNSVMEGARPILQAVAAGLKEASGSVSTLRGLVNDGKVSSEAFFRAFLAGMPQIDAMASKTSGTVGQAAQRMENAFTVVIGKLDEALRVSGRTAASFDTLAKAIQRLPEAFRANAGAIDTFLAGLEKIMRVIPALRALAPAITEARNALQGSVSGGGLDFQSASRLADINVKLAQDEKALAFAREVAGKSGLENDRARLDNVQQRIRGFEAEKAAIEATAKANRDAAGAKLPAHAGPGGRAAEGARDPMGQAPSVNITPVSLASFKVPGSKDKSGSSSEADAFASAESRVRRNISLLQDEARQVDATTEARERSRKVIELETIAKDFNAQKGLGDGVVTDAQRQSIDELAAAYGRAAAAAEQAGERSAEFKAGLQEFSSGISEAFQAAVIRGEDLGQVLGNLAQRLQSKIFDRLFDSLIGAAFGGGAGGGFASIIGSIFGGGTKLAVGGPVRGPGGPSSDSVPAMLSNGEYVIRAAEAGKHRALLDAINGGRLPHFANGGPVGGAIPAVALPGIVPGSGSGAPVENHFTVNVQGGAGTPEQNTDLADKIGQQVRDMAKSMVAGELRTQMRPGGLLRG